MARRPANQGSKWIRRDKRVAIYLRDGCRCAYCGRTPAMGAVLTLDHLVAVERGGTNEATNLVTSCRSCNSAKQDLTIRAWYRVLRAAGKDTDRIGRRIRRLVQKDIRPYRARAKAILASLDDGDRPATLGEAAHLAVVE